MKHVVHVSNDFDPISGGISSHLQNLLPLLSEKKLHITLLVPTASNGNRSKLYVDSRYDNFTVVRADYPETKNLLSKSIHLAVITNVGLRWIDEQIQRINLIHQHDSRATRFGATWYAKKRGIPLVWTNHLADFWSSDFASVLSSVIPGFQADGMISVHKSMAEMLKSSRWFHMPVRYISNGATLAHFEYKNNKQEIRNIVNILYPQRLIPEKGAIIFAKAIDLLLHQGLNTDQDMVFYIAGTEPGAGRDEKTILSVQHLLQEAVKEKQVLLLGNPSYKEMCEYYQTADIVVLPLQIETENISVFEAWASGSALITTRQVEKNGYMKHGENCIIIPNQDPDALAQAIARLSQDVGLKNHLAANGKKMVSEHFTWSQTADATVQLYSEISNWI